ncbi:MAG: 4-hydroxy-tetrahydrodipicolinate synthase [Thermodesulfobacteriota bacterium]|nr:4-hydroxy-tetrahydrodipicolinate synthase [Thermodesulfobacteriota bacterium]
MFHGVMAAIVTPFSKGRVDEEAFRRLINHQIENGISAIVPCGTTGESATLSPKEHKQVIQIAIDEIKGRIPVLAGTGSNSTAEAIALTVHAKEAGADGVLMISPYYNKPTQEGIYRHFKAVAEAAAPLPIIVYNIPGRTASNMLPETTARLAELENIVGIKEATGDMTQMAKTIELCGPDFAVISGDDGLTLPLLAIGGKGVISVTCHLVPARMVEMYNLFQAGELDKSRELYYSLLPLFRAMFIETNPIPVKTALGMMGMIEPELRPPLYPMSQDNQARLRSVLDDYGLLK